MKHGNGIKGREDKSNVMEILMVEVFARINMTKVSQFREI
jgi:hypothetical protein